MQLADRLRRARRSGRISQQRLADVVGVSRHTVIRWEKGEGEPEIAALWIIAEALNVSTSYLVGRRTTPERAEFLAPDEREALELFRTLSPDARKDFLQALREARELMRGLREGHAPKS